jgi:hypothetical protein
MFIVRAWSYEVGQQSGQSRFCAGTIGLTMQSRGDHPPFGLIRRGGKDALADRIVCSEFLSDRRIKLAFRDELMFGT